MEKIWISMFVRDELSALAARFDKNVLLQSSLSLYPL